jgi:hypothetical protein
MTCILSDSTEIVDVLAMSFRVVTKQSSFKKKAIYWNYAAILSPEVNLDEVPSSQKRQVTQPLSLYASLPLSRNENIYRAYHGGGYSMKAIADFFELHYSSISKIVKSFENSKFKT